MPEFDVHTPSPDDGHEAIRVAVVQAITDLQVANGGLDISLSLADTLFSLADSVFEAVVTLQAARAQFETDVAALTSRIEALEPVEPAEPDPPTEPVADEQPTDPTEESP